MSDVFGHVHLVGIGGTGMSGIAQLLLDLGHRVSGSDIRDSDTLARLRHSGADVFIGHDAKHLGSADTVITTGALWPDNPEYLAALGRNIPVLSRAEALNVLIGEHRVIAVAGAHGKSTSTGMLVTVLRELEVDAGFVNGAVITRYGRSAAKGVSELFVVEADESDGSFLSYPTSIALVTNVDADHLDHYGSQDAFEDAFVRFAQGAKELVVISADDVGSRRVVAKLRRNRVVTFGFAEDADVRLSEVFSTARVSFVLHYAGQVFPVQLAIPGEHNAVNAAGVFALLVSLGYPAADVAHALTSFTGIARRFQFHGELDGVRVYDDYAHHPSEVEATLKMARSVVEGLGRVVAIHQPHLYSRTRIMAGEFAEVYEQYADHTIVLDIFAAREDPEPGVSGALIANRFTDQSRVDFLPDWGDAARRVAEIVRVGDMVMTLNPGDAYLMIPQIFSALREANRG